MPQTHKAGAIGSGKQSNLKHFAKTHLLILQNIILFKESFLFFSFRKYGTPRSTLLVPEHIQYGPRDSNYMSASQKYAGLQTTDPNNSTYAHIWELRNVQPPHMQNSLRPGTLPTRDRNESELFSPVQGQGQGQPPVGSLRRPYLAHQSKEHVYESPKFARKDSSESFLEGGPYYHEFDPSALENTPQGPAQGPPAAHGDPSFSRLPDLGPSSKSE